MDQERELDQIVAAILESQRRGGDSRHHSAAPLPSREAIWAIIEDLLRLLFPGFREEEPATPEEHADRTSARILSVADRLEEEIAKGEKFALPPSTEGKPSRTASAREVTLRFLEQIPSVRELLATDIEAAYEGDPAARSDEEIILAYPCLEAIAVYRLAHLLYCDDVPLVPRVMTEYVHSRTGIDIHPGAEIGRRFFIDHGTGVVIGETTTIGDNVKIYQGVTLGARSLQKDEQGRVIKGRIKRHPDIESDVTIYSGATILGGDVRIGRGSVIGGNVWLMHSVPPYTKIMVTPPQEIHERGKKGG